VPKCTRTPQGLPATRLAPRSCLVAATLLAILLTVTTVPLHAQSASGDTELFAAPGSRVLANVKAGAPLVLGESRGGFVQGTVEGWLAAPLVASSRDSFNLVVRGSRTVRLRASASPNAAIVAEVRGGTGLQELGRQGTWVRVRRTGWISAARVASSPGSGPAQSAPSGEPGPSLSSVDTSRVDDSAVPLTPTVETTLAAAPDGDRIATVLPGARAVVTGRDRGWVRVRIEGWARERDFAVADTALRGNLSAADLRADPDGTKGRLVHWDVQVLAHQVADPLRKGLANQEPYLLAQGPGRENSLLYLAIPPTLAATAREIPDMTTVTITARVRFGRSEPVGVPVLDLVTIVGR
jgi:SH3-like domain-containing protein